MSVVNVVGITYLVEHGHSKRQLQIIGFVFNLFLNSRKTIGSLFRCTINCFVYNAFGYKTRFIKGYCECDKSVFDLGRRDNYATKLCAQFSFLMVFSKNGRLASVAEN